MHPDELAALRTPDGAAALAAAAEVLASPIGGDPLAAANALRTAGVSASLAAAALTQATLRARAVGKFGPDAARMFFTRAGLEQATRAVVADRRAARLRAAGVRRLADLGCGLGADTLAAARAGIEVYAVDADPGTAALAAANVAAAGLTDLVTVVCADATTVDVDGYDAVFCDPARRSGTGRRTFDPDSYSPSWDFVRALVARVPRAVVKAAPGIDHALIPPRAEAEWVSVDREVVEAAFWCGPLAAVPRRATLLRTRPAPQTRPAPPTTPAPAPPTSRQLTGDGGEPVTVGPVRRYLYDPDGAVVRAHLVAAFAATVDGTLADETIAYVYADTAVDTPYARCLEITDVLPFSLKRLRSLLRERGVTRLEILKRGSALEPARLRRDLRLGSGPAGGGSASLVLTRVAGAPTALLAQPISFVPNPPPAADLA